MARGADKPKKWLRNLNLQAAWYCLVLHAVLGKVGFDARALFMTILPTIMVIQPLLTGSGFKSCSRVDISLHMHTFMVPLGLVDMHSC